MPRVVVLGSSNTDMTVRVPTLPAPGETLLGGSFLTGPGGKGANQAVAARRAGAEVVFLAAVGDDLFGRQALEHYGREGIDVSHVQVVAGAPSGVALIFVSEAGENMIAVAPGANAQLGPETVDRWPDSLFVSGDVLLAGLEVPLETVVRAVERARRAGMRIVLNPAPADPGLLRHDLLRHVEVLTPNRGEARLLAGSGDDPALAAKALLSLGLENLVVTLGSEGCVHFRREAGAAEGDRIPAYPAVAVDTVGAGDAFNGALAAALAAGKPLRGAMAWACAAAALAVTRPGAQAALAERAAIDRLIAEHPNR
jgi:ribokinase